MLLSRNDKKNLSSLQGIWDTAEVKLAYSPNKKTGVTIKTPSDVYKAFLSFWDMGLIYIQEQVGVLYVNEKQRLLGFKVLSTGQTDETYINFNLLFGYAFVWQAKYFFLAHNHPYGTLQPSKEDKEVTHIIKQIGCILKCELLDHIILSAEGYCSMTNKGNV